MTLIVKRSTKQQDGTGIAWLFSGTRTCPRKHKEPDIERYRRIRPCRHKEAACLLPRNCYSVSASCGKGRAMWCMCIATLRSEKGVYISQKPCSAQGTQLSAMGVP